MNLRSNKQMRQVLGVSEKYFNILLGHFNVIVVEEEYERYYSQPYRERRLGGGRKARLATSSDKLAYVLYYMKNYPTFTVLGERFDMTTSTAHDNVKRYLPLLKTTLELLDVMPKKEFKNDEELSAYLKKKVLVH